jgi:hypothetical protein
MRSLFTTQRLRLLLAIVLIGAMLSVAVPLLLRPIATTDVLDSLTKGVPGALIDYRHVHVSPTHGLVFKCAHPELARAYCCLFPWRSIIVEK